MLHTWIINDRARQLTQSELAFIWMSHDTHMNESCMSHTWVSRVAHINESRHTCEYVMAHVWLTHYLLTSKMSCIYVCVSHIWMRQYLNKSSWDTHHTCEWVWMSHGTHINEFHLGKSHVNQTYEWVQSHVWTSRGTHMNESRHTCDWVMAHTWRRHYLDVHRVATWVMSHFWNESQHT